MTTFKGIARSTVTVEFTGTEEEFIELAEELSEGLDSHDRGDALGYFVFETQMYNELAIVRQRPDGTMYSLTASNEPDLFEWEGI